MTKIKEANKELADLAALSRQQKSALVDLDMEGYQSQIEIELKRLLKTFTMWVSPLTANAATFSRATTFTDSHTAASLSGSGTGDNLMRMNSGISAATSGNFASLLQVPGAGEKP